MFAYSCYQMGQKVLVREICERPRVFGCCWFFILSSWAAAGCTVRVGSDPAARRSPVVAVHAARGCCLLPAGDAKGSRCVGLMDPQLLTRFPPCMGRYADGLNLDAHGIPREHELWAAPAGTPTTTSYLRRTDSSPSPHARAVVTGRRHRKSATPRPGKQARARLPWPCMRTSGSHEKVRPRRATAGRTACVTAGTASAPHLLCSALAGRRTHPHTHGDRRTIPIPRLRPREPSARLPLDECAAYVASCSAVHIDRSLTHYSFVTVGRSTRCRCRVLRLETWHRAHIHTSLNTKSPPFLF
jgi:hypothetical protein